MTLHKIIRRSLDDVAFAEFDRNPNFVHDDVLACPILWVCWIALVVINFKNIFLF